ncbi:MAG: hypothetical protein R3237_00565 [Nitrosopumilaceae archaeon]|nr:hypothetical protein [Nitrosopumilaceae archaeon]
MSQKMPPEPIVFLSDKIYVHHWPLDTPKWDSKFKERVDQELHKNKKLKKIQIKGNYIQINNFLFTHLQKIGITIPLFKKETTMVFEAKFDDYFAHVHITSKGVNYLEIFNSLMIWKNTMFPE